ncbi:hypothetical protein ACFOON_12985 [Novosphingobium piscinae]|uniref:Uncharacterized protein n=1 Tax=Novosphingobium piscinae TaxID=1507448 RepID=A0A7X1KQL8_9SPHN|nr:hypothetical protein [Novosphingobium piscinae]MBC2669690.1 hypothetical protein [Novosphingobium piscinae]
MVLVLLNLLLGLVAVISALRLGGDIERRGAWLIVAMYGLGFAGDWLLGSRSAPLSPAALAQDLVAFVGFSYLGIYSKRVWPLWAAAFQLLSVGAHGVRAFEIAVRPIVYAWMMTGPTWAVLVLLLIGTFGHRRRMSSSASARSWPS